MKATKSVSRKERKAFRQRRAHQVSMPMWNRAYLPIREQAKQPFHCLRKWLRMRGQTLPIGWG